MIDKLIYLVHTLTRKRLSPIPEKNQAFSIVCVVLSQTQALASANQGCCVFQCF